MASAWTSLSTAQKIVPSVRWIRYCARLRARTVAANNHTFAFARPHAVFDVVLEEGRGPGTRQVEPLIIGSRHG